jgi:hypothetical protein
MEDSSCPPPSAVGSVPGSPRNVPGTKLISCKFAKHFTLMWRLLHMHFSRCVELDSANVTAI